MQTDYLRLIGWNDDRVAEFSRFIKDYNQNKEPADTAQGRLIPARVIGVHRDIFEVQTAEGRSLCTPSGRFRQSARLWPAVGDWVGVLPLDGESGVITDMLDRRSALSRGASGGQTAEQVIAANIDYVFVVTGLDNDFNLRRIERYITLVWNSGAVPVIILNKADLVPDPGEYVDRTAESAPGVDILVTRALEGEGVGAVREYFQSAATGPASAGPASAGSAATGVLVGSSGSGKSTLTNQLLELDVQKTREVRGGDQRGRHTTTARTLFALPGGGALIDTPGLREVGLWGEESAVDESFGDIAGLAAACRFSDCTHQHEPGCAVQAAIRSGELPEERFQAYMKLKREMAYLTDRQEMLRKKEEWHKQISKEIRRFYRDR
ncbi:MAG: ribosome small subunit-dependent GTPase A [Spirochaetota bacterium]|nr:ribosome small subunit-dependent GTPase A [Spirochaetota bacterium]